MSLTASWMLFFWLICSMKSWGSVTDNAIDFCLSSSAFRYYFLEGRTFNGLLSVFSLISDVFFVELDFWLGFDGFFSNVEKPDATESTNLFSQGNRRVLNE